MIVCSAPRLIPSSLYCTPTTPTLSEAVAEMVIVPETVADAAGEAIDTAGAVVSAASVVNVESAETERLPAASCDLTR